MTVVAEDRHGLYVLLDGRVGRPHAGQAAGLSAGAQVRAAVQGDAVRVRYGGGEQLWGLYLSRRQAPARPAEFQYAVGQRWRTRAGDVATVRSVNPDGSMMAEGSWYYRHDGMFGGRQHEPDYGGHLVELIEPETPKSAATTLRSGNVPAFMAGQVWRRHDKLVVRVARVLEDGSILSRAGVLYGADGRNKTAPGAGTSLRNMIASSEKGYQAYVRDDPADVARLGGTTEEPGGPPLNPDGTYAYAVGQVWRTREGRELEVRKVGAYSANYPTFTAQFGDGNWRRDNGQFLVSDTESHQDLVAFVRGPA